MSSSSSRCVSENIAIAAFEALCEDWNSIIARNTADVWFTIILLDFSSNGRKACVTAR